MPFKKLVDEIVFLQIIKFALMYGHPTKGKMNSTPGCGEQEGFYSLRFILHSGIQVWAIPPPLSKNIMCNFKISLLSRKLLSSSNHIPGI